MTTFNVFSRISGALLGQVQARTQAAALALARRMFPGLPLALLPAP